LLYICILIFSWWKALRFGVQLWKRWGKHTKWSWRRNAKSW